MTASLEGERRASLFSHQRFFVSFRVLVMTLPAIATALAVDMDEADVKTRLR